MVKSGGRSNITGRKLLEAGKRLFSLLLAVYLLFLVGRSVYLNYRVKQQLAKIEAEIKHVRNENQRLSNLIAYYQTETFRELEARSKLGLKKPGETVIAVPENADEPLEQKLRPREEEPKQSETTPNYIKWWEYLFGDT